MMTKKSNRKPKVCPFVQDPFEECYVKNMSSFKVEPAIQFCGGNYEACEIYQKRMANP